MSQEFHLHPLLEYLAVILWAISGVLAGQERGLDIVGVFAVALVSSTGGGILRDGVFLQRPLWIMSDPAALAIVLTAVLAAVLLLPLLTQSRSNFDKAIALLDAVGVPAFAIVGLTLALATGTPLGAAIFIGMVSSVGGGVIRDVLVGEVPSVFRPGQYSALIALLGLLMYILLVWLDLLEAGTAAWLSISLAFALRLLVIRFNWRTLPADQVAESLNRSLVRLRPSNRRKDKSQTKTSEGQDASLL
jgi:uncharacterized membrane protein YeiH